MISVGHYRVYVYCISLSLTNFLHGSLILAGRRNAFANWQFGNNSVLKIVFYLEKSTHGMYAYIQYVHRYIQSLKTKKSHATVSLKWVRRLATAAYILTHTFLNVYILGEYIMLYSYLRIWGNITVCVYCIYTNIPPPEVKKTPWEILGTLILLLVCRLYAIIG